MGQFGYFGVFLLIMIENVFPPIPSEVILTFGGFMTTYSEMTRDGCHHRGNGRFGNWGDDSV